jgi:hypothetical protein
MQRACRDKLASDGVVVLHLLFQRCVHSFQTAAEIDGVNPY